MIQLSCTEPKPETVIYLVLFQLEKKKKKINFWLLQKNNAFL